MNPNSYSLVFLFLCQLIIIGVHGQRVSTSSSSSVTVTKTTTSLSSQNNNRVIKEILTSGIGQIIWRSIVSTSIDSLSDKCSKSLDETVRGLTTSSWGYEFLDATAKTSSGFLEGTVSSFGDYDQCLNINSFKDANDVTDASSRTQFRGKYCTLKFSLDFNETNGQLSAIQSFLLSRIPMFNHYYKQIGLCLPSTCSEKDVNLIVDQALARYPLKRRFGTFCDTLQSIDRINKWREASFGQKVAGYFLLTLVLMTILGTLEEWLLPSKLLKDFSIATNHRSLFANSNNERVNFIDGLRISIILFGIAGHCFGCLESVPGWYTVSNLSHIKMRLRSLFVQPMLNEGGLGIGVTFVGGFATYWSTYKYIASGQLNYPRALFNRWLRYTPALMAMVAIDIIWPFFGSGPMYTQISVHLQDKCLSSWWMNLLALGNMKSAPENCTPHTFYSSIDMQLYILSLLIVYLLLKKPFWGLMASVSLIVLGNFWVVYKTSTVLISPVLIDANVTVEKTLNYLDHVHFATYAHLSNYFIGLLVAYSLTVEGFLERYKIIFIICHPFALFLSGTVHFATAIHNTFNLLTIESVPYYIVGVKLAYVFYASIMLYVYQINLNALNAKKKKQEQEQKQKKEQEEKEKQEQMVKTPLIRSNSIANTAVTLMSEIIKTTIGLSEEFSTSPLMQAIIRLSFSLYVVNYTFIRFDFFSSRVHNEFVPNALHLLSKRLIYTYAMTILAAYAFHIVIFAPFDALRKRFSISAVNK